MYTSLEAALVGRLLLPLRRALIHRLLDLAVRRIREVRVEGRGSTDPMRHDHDPHLDGAPKRLLGLERARNLVARAPMRGGVVHQDDIHHVLRPRIPHVAHQAGPIGRVLVAQQIAALFGSRALFDCAPRLVRQQADIDLAKAQSTSEGLSKRAAAGQWPACVSACVADHGHHYRIVQLRVVVD